MTALIGVDSLDVHQRLHRLILQQDAVSTHNVASHSSNLAAVCSASGLHHGDAANCHLTTVVHARDLHAHQKALLHKLHTLNELSLHKLLGSNGLAELHTLLRVLECGFACTCSHANSEPGDKDARVLQDLFSARSEVSSKLEALTIRDEVVTQDNVSVLDGT